MEPSRLKAAAPSLVTSGNLVVGLVSVALSALGHFEGAAWAIVYCGILDKLDGTLARTLHVEGAFGMEMDSFADYTSFGLAPAALLWFLSTSHGIPAWPMSAWIAACAVAFPLGAAVRLALFNSLTHENPNHFQGVPTTMVAGLFATLYLSLVDLKVPVDPVWVLPSAAVACAALMLCHLRVPKLKGGPNRWKNRLLVATLLVMTGLAVAQVVPVVLFGLGVIYVLSGFVRRRSPDDGQGTGGGVSSAPGGEA